MPTFGGWGHSFWSHHSTVKYFRRSRQRIEGKWWIVVDREYCRREGRYKYKLVEA